ncbi:FadR/GntR family transcriptional regulator [Tsuneonella dongtanensis]|nr:FadR/GntR family transcriptional regulator [Tsuneonella dongtanensis]
MAEPRLFQSIAERISALIDDGTFPPGSRLPGERELAERFDVSRVTIREAEIALQAIGRIEIKTGSGVYVSERKGGVPGALPQVSPFEVTEARSLVEAEAAALAAKHIGADEIARLETLIAAMESSDEEVSTEADREFHATIARASGNGALLHLIETLWRMREDIVPVKRAYEAVCDDDPKARANEHREILDALRARDCDRARSAMRAHFHRLIAAMLDATEREALRELQERVSQSRERFLAGSV